MSAPAPPPKILSSFTELSGGLSQVIAPGEPLITLGGNGATWWEGGKAVTVTLPSNIDGYGARRTADGKSLRVGLGTLDLAARTWRPEPALQSFNPVGPHFVYPVRQVAWFIDAVHVAILIETRDAQGRRNPQELVIASSDGRVRGRRGVAAVTGMVASSDRVLIAQAGAKPLVVDLDAKLVAEPDLAVSRVSEGAGMFAATLAPRGVALVRPSDGATVARWEVDANDAVPVPHGVVSVDFEGNVHVGCVDGGKVREVASVASGVKAAIVQYVGSQIVVAGAQANPVHVATFSNPCH